MRPSRSTLGRSIGIALGQIDIWSLHMLNRVALLVIVFQKSTAKRSTSQDGLYELVLFQWLR
jgi:hypothetical protein